VERQVLTSVAAALSSGPPALPGFLAPLESPLAHYGLWAIALFVFLEDFGIPVPGETVLIAGAVFAGSGRLNIVVVGVVGFLAAVAGDNVGYAIGRFGGRALVERWGRYVFLTKERLDKAEQFFARHGGKIIVVARYIEGLRQANGIIAGITGMRWLRFLAFNALGAALWVGTWVSVGYFAGQHITTVYDAITNYSLYAAIAAVVLIAAWILLHLRKRRRAGNQAAAEPEPAKAAGGVAGARGAAGAVDKPAGAEAAATPARPGAAETAGGPAEATGRPAEAAGTTAEIRSAKAAGTTPETGSANGHAGPPAKAARPALARRDQDSDGSARS
jgi:membrane protein DedA with SNARE-associated domain